MRWLTLSIAAALASTGYANAEQASERYIVKSESLAQVVQLDGVVQPINQGTVASQTSGRIVGLNVDVNDYVKKGTVLLEISAVQQSASLDAAQAQLASAIAQDREAQAQVKRYRQLFPKGAISQDVMDSAEARARSASAAVKSAQAAVAQAKESLGYTSVTAPYDGVVTQRHVELGETVAPGTPLVSGFSIDKLRVETEIPQRYQPAVSDVAQFEVVSPQGERILPTQYSLFSYADPQSHTFKIRLNLPEDISTFVPGMWVKTEFHYGNRDTILIPNSSVVRRAELSSVYRIQDDSRVLNPVRLGQTYGDYTEVLSGLEEGDVISTTALNAEGK
ncbi:efflux RND transporter periplasmic adaptor subunit [Vibrio plantisponsor]|jgi:RND family efflux transporter MFP subunit|uniref:Efflux RND transporter periplasmic adaptor subunit n=1 Tax=Vibrio plantisponsor TaxID=664643 RepID=A0ABU4IMB4_9VIBR|nr:efflux RND transporter periplasmic adaptor subunit [Vibrio plantisponsor]MDW6019234.1 efflux RND transporter periplasmic adaptor subunit [Vibrio plantisponsor]NNM41896.1 efflux RND transporter periplasmic adaptor subunit [Vibrio plantisponsor]PNH86992.1 efflux RND transporter periplasmic adaptor subunit [Vibrio diazotrophicus]